MGKIISDIEVNKTLDDKGNIKERRISKREVTIENGEPSYIKLYTKVWMEFYGVPSAYKELFIALAMNMTACDSDDLEHSQLVNTCKPYDDIYMKACGWSSKDSLKKGLNALCACNAIKRVARGVYQINPSFAAKGKWLDGKDGDTAFSGVKKFVATFDFINGSMTTDVTYADEDEEL